MTLNIEGITPMTTQKKALSVSEVAALCNVGRGTVNYWIRSKKLSPSRIGRNYSISLEELFFFLKSTGREIPTDLVNGNLQSPFFRTVQNCWQYFQGRGGKPNCEDCMVFKNQLNVCFIANNGTPSHCEKACDECPYYLETYLPRIQFIHQIDLPAAVYKDLYFWGGNRRFAELCELPERDLVGKGIEQVVHPDSLETVISNVKKRDLGDPNVPIICSVFLKNRQNRKLKVRVGVCPLREPSGANFVFVEPTVF